MSWVQSLNYETQLLPLGCSPYPWHQPTDCPNLGIPSTLPDIVASSSAHGYVHLGLAPLCIVPLLPQGQVKVSYSLDCGTLFLYKGLGGQCETHSVSSTVLGASADSLWAIRPSEWGIVHGVLVPASLWDDMS